MTISADRWSMTARRFEWWSLIQTGIKIVLRTLSEKPEAKNKQKIQQKNIKN